MGPVTGGMSALPTDDKAAFRFLPVRADLDLAGWGEDDIFAH